MSTRRRDNRSEPVAVAVSTFVYVNYKESNSTSLLKANAEALAADETDKLDTNYKNIHQQCKIRVGANAEVKIFGLGILKADGEGYIYFDGQTICEANGMQTCTPRDCIDVYEVIFRGE